jgi:phytanoyl-CoA dioxygenase PhyH
MLTATNSEIDTIYKLPADKQEDFRRDGHVCLPGVLPQPDVESFRETVQAATAARKMEMPPLEQRDAYGQAFLQYMNLWPDSEPLRRYVLAKRFARLAAELLGVDGVRIYHDQALHKEPGGGPTPWHQDQYYWPVDTDQTITMWMPLVDISVDMGMLTFASRSHRKGYLGTLPISEESEQVFQEYVRKEGIEIVRQPAMSAGDATFHYGWTLHAAPGNASETMREVMTVIYVADGCHVTEPVNENQVCDIGRWMPGLEPGDLVSTELNPLAWHRSK